MTREELMSLVPRTKYDTECVQALADLGYPAIEPILPELLEWIQDMNWLVALVLAPFLASISLPLAPRLRLIMTGDDNLWKNWILRDVIGRSPALLAELIRGR